jgi:hypothetical protein
MQCSDCGLFDHLVGAGERRRRHVERDWRNWDLWSVQAGSLRLDVGRSDHLTPFLCLLDDDLVEFGRRARERRCAQVSEPRRDPGIDEPCIDLLVELVDDFDGRVRHTNLVRIASSLRADMIFGKDSWFSADCTIQAGRNR